MNAKKISCLLFILFFVTCKNNDKKSENDIFPKKDDRTTDSTCSNSFPGLKTKNCKLINYCDKVLDNAAGTEIARKIHEDSSQINFNTANIKFYSLKKDTLVFSLYFLNPNKVFCYPTRFYINEDTFRFNMTCKGDIADRHDYMHCFQFEIKLNKGTNFSAIKYELK